MLTDKDIAMIREWRKEVTANRTKPVTLLAVSITKHPLSGEEIEDEAPYAVDSVVTERSSRTAPEVVYQDGAIVRQGDLWFSVDIDVLATEGLVATPDFDSIRYVEDDGRRYRVVAWDRKGIGETNRIEFVGKAVT